MRLRRKIDAALKAKIALESIGEQSTVAELGVVAKDVVDGIKHRSLLERA